jgi:DNA-binding response OmpR family regulator
MRLLMVEDDKLFGSALHKALLRAGYAVDWIERGKDLVAAMRTAEYDCVLLDLNLPDATGEASLRAIRGRSPGLSVIVITARGGLNDRIGLLELGADDYLVKPVDLDEVTARVRAVTRRAQGSQGSSAELEHGALRLNPARRTATWNGDDAGPARGGLVRLGRRDRQQCGRGLHPLPAPQVPPGTDQDDPRRGLPIGLGGAACLATRFETGRCARG